MKGSKKIDLLVGMVVLLFLFIGAVSWYGVKQWSNYSARYSAQQVENDRINRIHTGVLGFQNEWIEKYNDLVSKPRPSQDFLQRDLDFRIRIATYEIEKSRGLALAIPLLRSWKNIKSEPESLLAEKAIKAIEDGIRKNELRGVPVGTIIGKKEIILQVPIVAEDNRILYVRFSRDSNDADIRFKPHEQLYGSEGRSFEESFNDYLRELWEN